MNFDIVFAFTDRNKSHVGVRSMKGHVHSAKAGIRGQPRPRRCRSLRIPDDRMFNALDAALLDSCKTNVGEAPC